MDYALTVCDLEWRDNELGDESGDTVLEMGLLICSVKIWLSFAISSVHSWELLAVSTRFVALFSIGISSYLEIFVAICSIEVLFKLDVLYLHADEIWPFCLHIKHVSESSVMNIRKVTLSWVIVIELSRREKSSGLIYNCLRKLITCANYSVENSDFKREIWEVVLIFRSCSALSMASSEIIGYTLERIIFFDGSNKFSNWYFEFVDLDFWVIYD